MPSNLHMDEIAPDTPIGSIYIVATPIGNREDITLRALNTLKSVDLVAAEDTRHTGRLLEGYGINAPLVAYHEHNEEKVTPRLLNKLSKGAAIALVSDAGTPGVSDPGFRLITEAVKAGIAVVPIPGVSAVVTAISASGLPTDAFYFLGFIPKKRGKRESLLKEISRIPATLILYESPNRIIKLLMDVKGVLGDRQAVLAREMTKLHEEFLRGSLTEITAKLELRPKIKGECTLLVSGYTNTTKAFTDDIRQKIRSRLLQSEESLAGLAREISAEYGLSRNQVYREALAIRREIRQNE
jgi:16S rRNA (cytidine1402-2'-O)-methyltransferase